MLTRVAHCDLMAQCTHIDVGNPSLTAFVAELMATLTNPGGGMSEFLQLPGQTYELLVALAPGKYFFQCDPHALLGMVGRLEVEDEN